MHAVLLVVLLLTLIRILEKEDRHIVYYGICCFSMTASHVSPLATVNCCSSYWCFHLFKSHLKDDLLYLSLYKIIKFCCGWPFISLSLFHSFFSLFFLFSLSILFHDWQRAFLVNNTIFHFISTSFSPPTSSSIRVSILHLSIIPFLSTFLLLCCVIIRLMVKPMLESDLGSILIATFSNSEKHHVLETNKTIDILKYRYDMCILYISKSSKCSQ